MLSVDGLCVSYGRKQVVRDLAVRVERGEFVGILGANGAGKTTTLKAIAGILRASAGTVRLDGEDVTRRDSAERVRRGLVLVPEGRHLFPEMTVTDNLTVAWEVVHGRRENPQAAFDRVYELFPRLRERARQLAGSLSGGEQQMVALGRGLLSEPKVLLLDEPSLGLAPALVDEVFEALISLNRAGMSVLMVEQDAARALQVCSRAYVVEHGEIKLAGTSAALRDDPRVLEAFLGSTAVESGPMTSVSPDGSGDPQ
jgi:branched-chain amino acid transport system ATP-binding protein